MSVDCTKVIGYTITLATDDKDVHKWFDYEDEHLAIYKKYSKYEFQRVTPIIPGSIILIEDGMNGQYVKLVKAEVFSRNNDWPDDENEELELKDTDDDLTDLAEAYEELTGNKFDRSMARRLLWWHFS